MQCSPNHPAEVQEWLVNLIGTAGEVDITGGAVIVCKYVRSVVVARFVVLGSLQPNQPGVLQLVDVLASGVEVTVGEGVMIVVEVVVVISSLHPNQPGVLHVEVDVVVVGGVVVGVTPVAVVVSSRHPHHPGVLHVDVLVCTLVVVVTDVVVVVLLPVTSFHSGQS